MKAPHEQEIEMVPLESSEANLKQAITRSLRMAKRMAVSAMRVVVLVTVVGSVSAALNVTTNATEKSITHNAGTAQVTITDLGLIPGGTFSSGLAINNQPVIVGLANDSTFAIQRPFWNANTGVIVGFADNFSPASTAIPEHLNGSREMAGSEVYGDNVYQGIYWNSTGQAFVLPPLAGFDPDYGAVHTRAHGINNLSQLVGTGKEGEPNFFTHAALWLNKDTEAVDLGFLGQGIPLNYSEAYGINDLTHVVGNSAVGTAIDGFLWRNGQMTDLGPGQAKAINNKGLIAGLDNLTNKPAIWTYDITNPNDPPKIQQLPIPAGFFSATTTAVNDSGDVAGYAGSPSIDAHAILWRNGQAIDLGVWPGGHYSIANGINNLGQIVGTGTVAGDNLDHALMWTVSGGIPCEDLVSFQARCQSNGSAHRLQAKLALTDTSHSGEQVIITVDGHPFTVTINGSQAQLSRNNPPPGEHTIELTDPAGCFPPRVPSCQ